jgi:hypothetical protein
VVGIATLRPRVIGFAALAAAGVAVAGVSLWWWIAASTVRSGIERWAEGERARGATVTYESLGIGGWPLRVRVRAEKAVFAAAGLSWTGEAAVAEAPLGDFSTIAVTLPGKQAISAGGAGLTTDAGFTGTVTLSPEGEPLRIDAAGESAVLAAASGEPVIAEGIVLTAERPAVLPASHRETGLTAALTVRALKPAGPWPDAFAKGLSAVEIRLRVQGVPPRLDRADLDAWSKDGGTVEIDRVHAEWGPARVDASGTLTLDKELQPLAALTLAVRGADAAVVAFGDRLPPSAVRNARLVIGMLSRPAADGSGSEVQVPLSIQDRELYVGPIRAARFGAIVW